MLIPLQKCFVLGCKACFPTHFGYVYHLMEEHEILVPAVYSCEECSQAMCDASTFKARENWLVNRMFARYKVALKAKEKNGDHSTKMLPTTWTESCLEPQVIISEEDGGDAERKHPSVEYTCFVHGCNSKYGRKHQFKMHMLNAHGLCIVQNEFCQFCSDILDQFYHFGRKLKGGYKRKASRDDVQGATATATTQNEIGTEKSRKRKKTKDTAKEAAPVDAAPSCPPPPAPPQANDFEDLVDEFLRMQRERQRIEAASVEEPCDTEAQDENQSDHE